MSMSSESEGWRRGGQSLEMETGVRGGDDGGRKGKGGKGHSGQPGVDK